MGNGESPASALSSLEGRIEELCLRSEEPSKTDLCLPSRETVLLSPRCLVRSSIHRPRYYYIIDRFWLSPVGPCIPCSSIQPEQIPFHSAHSVLALANKKQSRCLSGFRLQPYTAFAQMARGAGGMHGYCPKGHVTQTVMSQAFDLGALEWQPIPKGSLSTEEGSLRRSSPPKHHVAMRNPSRTEASQPGQARIRAAETPGNSRTSERCRRRHREQACASHGHSSASVAVLGCVS